MRGRMKNKMPECCLFSLYYKQWPQLYLQCIKTVEEAIAQQTAFSQGRFQLNVCSKDLALVRRASCHQQGVIIKFRNSNKFVISFPCHYSTLLSVSQIKQFQQKEKETFRTYNLLEENHIVRFFSSRTYIWETGNKNIFSHAS